MTRLASLCAAALEVANAVAVRVEDVVGEWVDSWGPRPPTLAADVPAIRLAVIEECADLAKGMCWHEDLDELCACGGSRTANAIRNLRHFPRKARS